MWQNFVDSEEYDSHYEEWFVSQYLNLGSVYPTEVFFYTIKWGLEYCLDKHKMVAPGNGFVFVLLFLQKKGLICSIDDWHESVYYCKLTDEGKEVLTWMQERERKEKENEKTNMDNGLVVE